MSLERGSMAVAMAAAVGVVAFVAVAVAGLASLYAARTQAQAAADAAALAAAVSTYPPASGSSPQESAREVAAGNGASLLVCRCPLDGSLAVRTTEVVAGVVVAIPIFGEMTVRASSRAEFDPQRWLGR